MAPRTAATLRRDRRGANARDGGTFRCKEFPRRRNQRTSRLPAKHVTGAPAPGDDAGVDTALYVSYAVLEQGLDEVRQSPRDEGRLDLIVRTPATDEREILVTGELDEEQGLV